MKTPPTMLAKDAESRSQRKSVAAPSKKPRAMFCSTRLASKGAAKEFEVLDTRTKILNRDNEIAMRRVRVPAILTEYARVPIK